MEIIYHPEFMIKIKASNGEGASLQEPSIFDGKDYASWKDEMKRYIKAVDLNYWMPIKVGVVINKSKCNWNSVDRKWFQDDCRSKFLISTFVSEDIFKEIYKCENARDMWEHLRCTYEGAEKAASTYHSENSTKSPTSDKETHDLVEDRDRFLEPGENEYLNEIVEQSPKKNEPTANTTESNDGYTETSGAATTSGSESKEITNLCQVVEAHQVSSINTVSISNLEENLSYIKQRDTIDSSKLNLEKVAKENLLIEKEKLLLEEKLKVVQNKLNKLEQQTDELILAYRTLRLKNELSIDCEECNTLRDRNKDLEESNRILTKSNHILDIRLKSFPINQDLRYVSKYKHRHKKRNLSTRNRDTKEKETSCVVKGSNPRTNKKGPDITWVPNSSH